MTSCQVSEKWNIGPSSSQPTTTPSAKTNASVPPVQRLTNSERRSSRRLSRRAAETCLRGMRKARGRMVRAGTRHQGTPATSTPGPHQLHGPSYPQPRARFVSSHVTIEESSMGACERAPRSAYALGTLSAYANVRWFESGLAADLGTDLAVAKTRSKSGQHKHRLSTST